MTKNNTKVICVKLPPNDANGNYISLMRVYDHVYWKAFSHDQYSHSIKLKEGSLFWIHNDNFDECFKEIESNGL